MKKFFIAAAAGLLIFGGNADVEASTVDNLETNGIEMQEMGKWARFRDKHILNRETDRERRERREWERRHRYGPPPPPPPRRGDYGPPPPPPRRGDYGAPPPPPPPRYGGRDYGAPPPPPPRHGGRDYGAPPPPPRR